MQTRGRLRRVGGCIFIGLFLLGLSVSADAFVRPVSGNIHQAELSAAADFESRDDEPVPTEMAYFTSRRQPPSSPRREYAGYMDEDDENHGPRRASAQRNVRHL